MKLGCKMKHLSPHAVNHSWCKITNPSAGLFVELTQGRRHGPFHGNTKTAKSTTWGAVSLQLLDSMLEMTSRRPLSTIWLFSMVGSEEKRIDVEVNQDQEPRWSLGRFSCHCVRFPLATPGWARQRPKRGGCRAPKALSPHHASSQDHVDICPFFLLTA